LIEEEREDVTTQIRERQGGLTCATESSNSEGSTPLSFWIFFLAVYILPYLPFSGHLPQEDDRISDQHWRRRQSVRRMDERRDT
jgi:hypothetical protein